VVIEQLKDKLRELNELEYQREQLETALKKPEKNKSSKKKKSKTETKTFPEPGPGQKRRTGRKNQKNKPGNKKD
jgi:hypothetical protein